MFRRAAPLSATAAGLIAVLAFADPASADRRGDAVCDPTQGSCEVSAGLEDEVPDSSGNWSAPSGGGGAAADDPFAGWNCTFKVVETDADSHAHAGARPSAEHELLMKTCTDPETGTSIQEAQWVAPGDDGTGIDPAVLAAEAVGQLQLPSPKIVSSPEGIQLVHLPTWLWLEGDSWSSQSATASVPGLSVTAQAVPVQAVWSLGDGTELTCQGAGTPWTNGMESLETSPDCGHTYSRSSAHAANGEYEVSVTVSWSVTWSGGGESGTVPGMTSQAATSWPVAESQGLVK